MNVGGSNNDLPRQGLLYLPVYEVSGDHLAGLRARAGDEVLRRHIGTLWNALEDTRIYGGTAMTCRFHEIPQSCQLHRICTHSWKRARECGGFEEREARK